MPKQVAIVDSLDIQLQAAVDYLHFSIVSKIHGYTKESEKPEMKHFLSL
jgi:hypothetical protein